MDVDHPCANPACQCSVKEHGSYCSETCKNAAENTDVPRRTCACGHTSCETVAPENLS